MGAENRTSAFAIARRLVTAPGLWAVVSALSGLVLLAVVGRLPGAPLGFPLDDAWIHLVYARGLTDDLVLGYNPGVPTTGCTSPLWALLLAPLHALLVSVPGDVDSLLASVMVLGGALHVVGAVVAARIVLALGGPSWGAALAGSVVGLSPPLCSAALSGMEVALTSALMLGGVLAAVRDRLGWAGLWLGLAALARPEAALVGLAVSAMSVARRRGARARVRGFFGLAIPALMLGVALVAYNLWASGRPLPATFYVKAATASTDLADRLLMGVRGLLRQVPPFGTWLGWLFAIASLLPGRLFETSARRRGDVGGGPPGQAVAGADTSLYHPASRVMPAAAGLAFFAGNLYVAAPTDPSAFYHLRYVLPSVPLLIVAATLGATALLSMVSAPRVRSLAIGVVVGLVAFEIAGSTASTSRSHHNDVRNINDVQRSIGEWLADRVPEGSYVAANDAGAIRYFSNRPVVDLEGLNTPELRSDPDRFAREHPVVAVAVIPEWYRPSSGTSLRVAMQRTTDDYTVTSFPAMATQVVAVCPEVASSTSPDAHGTARVITLVGRRTVTLWCRPWTPDGVGAASAWPGDRGR